MTNVLISAAGLCGATIIGAILGFFVKELPHKWNDAVLGYCAGIMLAASTLGLIVPAFEQTGLWWLVVIGVMAGALFLNVLDLVTPHLHHITGLDPEEHRNNARLSHVMLFVMAIALHKLPEGMAAGVSVCSSEGATEWGVSFGIALQNIPGNGDHFCLDDGTRFCCSHLLHLHFHRPARSGRHPVRFRFGFSLFYLPSRDVGFCRWCHALCNER